MEWKYEFREEKESRNIFVCTVKWFIGIKPQWSLDYIGNI